MLERVEPEGRTANSIQLWRERSRRFADLCETAAATDSKNVLGQFSQEKSTRRGSGLARRFGETSPQGWGAEKEGVVKREGGSSAVLVVLAAPKAAGCSIVRQIAQTAPRGPPLAGRPTIKPIISKAIRAPPSAFAQGFCPLAVGHAGVVAFSRIGHPATGEFQDATILAQFVESGLKREECSCIRRRLACPHAEIMHDDLSTIDKIVEIVGPLLHHAASLGKILCMIIGGTNLVALVVGKLTLDPIGMTTQFV